MIWVDAHACPKVAKELIYRSSARLVANRPLTAPPSPLIEVLQVKTGSDVADSYIVQHIAAGDLVITADIPLASLVVAQGATALDPRGEIHTANTIDERLAVRNLMEELRWAGAETGGPAAYGASERRRFAASPMRFLATLLGRPSNERPYLLIPVGYPAEGATVPTITKKPLDEVHEHLAARENPPFTDGATP